MNYQVNLTYDVAEDLVVQVLRVAVATLENLVGRDDMLDPEDQRNLEALRTAHNYFTVREDWL